MTKGDPTASPKSWHLAPGLPARQRARGTGQAVRRCEEEADGEVQAALFSVELRTQFYIHHLSQEPEGWLPVPSPRCSEARPEQTPRPVRAMWG